MKDLITVYLVSHNRRGLLERAVNSVLNQTYDLFELIIVDNGSTDGSQEYIDFLSECDHRIECLKLRDNKGACFARNLAIATANGLYITGIDDDDEWFANRLEIFYQTRDKLSDYSFLYADDLVVEQSSDRQRKYPKKAFTFSEFQKRNIVGNQVFTLSERLKFIGFDEVLVAAQDYDCFYRIAVKYGPAYYIREVTQKIYIGHGLGRISEKGRKLEGYIQFYAKHSEGWSNSSVKFQRFDLCYLRSGVASWRLLWSNLTIRNIRKFMLIKFNIMRKW